MLYSLKLSKITSLLIKFLLKFVKKFKLELGFLIFSMTFFLILINKLEKRKYFELNYLYFYLM